MSHSNCALWSSGQDTCTKELVSKLLTVGQNCLLLEAEKLVLTRKTQKLKQLKKQQKLFLKKNLTKKRTKKEKIKIKREKTISENMLPRSRQLCQFFQLCRFCRTQTQTSSIHTNTPTQPTRAHPHTQPHPHFFQKFSKKFKSKLSQTPAVSF